MKHLWLILITAIMCLLTSTPVLASNSVVNLTVTASVGYGIADFTIEQVSETEILFTWSYVGDADSIMIRGKYNDYPDDIVGIDEEPSDGFLIYSGNATSTSWYHDESLSDLFVKAWGQRENDNWIVRTDTGIAGGNMTLLSILAFCGVISFLAVRSTFFGLKLIAGMSWFAFFIYFKDNPPTIVTEGSGAHVAILVVAIGFGLMIVLSGLGRGINRSTKWTMGEEQETGGFKWKIPEWMNFREDEPARNRRKTNETLDDYRQTLRQAYRTGEFNPRRHR